MGYAPWTFRDNAGATWALGVIPNGQLTLTAGTFPQASSLVPLTDTVNGQVYGLIVIATPSGPQLDTTGPLSIPAIGPYIPLSAQGISQPFWVQTANGKLIGSFQGPPDPAPGPTRGGCFTPWIFLDNAGSAWAIGVNAQGQLTLSQVTPAPPQAMVQVPLVDTVNGSVYGIIVRETATGPKIKTTGPLTIPAVGSYIPMTAGTRPFWLQTANGQLIGSWQGDGGSPDPVIGQLYNLDMVNPSLNPPNLPNAGLPSGDLGGWLPNYSQPNGVGTQTFPAQQTGYPYSNQPTDAGLSSQQTGIPFEQGMGMNVSPCQHSLNNFEITFGTYQCQQAAFIRCPLCGFLIQIISPASLLYTEPGFEHISS